MQWKRVLLVSFCAFGGAILAFVVNFGFIDRIVVPDPCYYHSHDTTWLFDLFYEITSAEGGHPFPTILNFIFTMAAGVASGIAFARVLLKKRNEKKVVTGLQA